MWDLPYHNGYVIKNIDEQQKFLIIYDACLALIDLHAKNLVHGRPAIRDITWDKGRVTFLDFESRSNSRNQNWVVIRDMLFSLIVYVEKKIFRTLLFKSSVVLSNTL